MKKKIQKIHGYAVIESGKPKLPYGTTLLYNHHLNLFSSAIFLHAYAAETYAEQLRERQKLKVEVVQCQIVIKK